MARSTGRSETREKLLRAAEQLFAVQGVDGAQTRDIVRLAGQANPSAVQYHFGSRSGLLDEILRARQDRVHQALAPRSPELAAMTLVELLHALVTAEATELRTDQGRAALRISAQVGHRFGIRSRTPHPTLAGGGYLRFVDRIAERLATLPGTPGLPEPVRLERIDLALTVIGVALADRARQYDDEEQPLTDEALFLADLVAMTAALLQAPAPALGSAAAQAR